MLRVPSGSSTATTASSTQSLKVVVVVETLGSCQCVDPIEVILDGATSLCVSPVVSTYPEPKNETMTWRERKDARPQCRCPALLSGCDCKLEYVTKSKVVHTNAFYLRAIEILEAPSAPLAPLLNVTVFDSIKIKDLHEDTLIQVVGYNIEETNEYFTTWLFN
jgi:hypothetical protein